MSEGPVRVRPKWGDYHDEIERSVLKLERAVAERPQDKGLRINLAARLKQLTQAKAALANRPAEQEER